jgi:hypothetical protein
MKIKEEDNVWDSRNNISKREIEEELKKELLEKEKEACLIGSGDDMFYVKQVEDWFEKNDKMITNIIKETEKSFKVKVEKLIELRKGTENREVSEYEYLFSIYDLKEIFKDVGGEK